MAAALTPAARAVVLLEIGQGATLKDAAKVAGCTLAALRDAGRADPDFARALAAADAGGRETKARAPKPAQDAPGWAEAAAVSAAAHPEAPPPEPPARPVKVLRDDGRLDLDTVSEEAARFAPGPFGFLLWVDAQSVLASIPPLSPWWRWSLGGFYSSGKRWALYDVGRGGGKSTSLEKVAGSDTYFEPRVVPPSQMWSWPFISTNIGDAARRIRGLAAIYRALGLPVIGEGDGSGSKAKEGIKISYAQPAHIDLVDVRGNAVQLVSLAGTIGNVSGPSTIGGTIDEAAKLYDRAENANPLTEVIASFTQTFRARKGIRAICSSSSFEPEGTHFELVMQGDTETNYVARIGAPFLELALRGFDQVAAMEQARGDARAAAEIRTHAASLTADAPWVPTWVANPTLGSPDGSAWDGAALASRRELDALPDKKFEDEGLPRWAYWLRECGSLPMARQGGAGMAEQCRLAAAINQRLSERFSGRRRASREVMAIPGAPPGDIRYDGPAPRVRSPVPSWRQRKVL
jgi:hypothetical protein